MNRTTNFDVWLERPRDWERIQKYVAIRRYKHELKNFFIRAGVLSILEMLLILKLVG